jgi:hypothetical protein
MDVRAGKRLQVRRIRGSFALPPPWRAGYENVVAAARRYEVE